MRSSESSEDPLSITRISDGRSFSRMAERTDSTVSLQPFQLRTSTYVVPRLLEPCELTGGCTGVSMRIVGNDIPSRIPFYNYGTRPSHPGSTCLLLSRVRRRQTF